MAKPKLTIKQIHELWDVNVFEGTIKHRFNSPNAKIGDLATTLSSWGYLRVSKSINKKNYQWFAHQIIWVVAGNDWPEKGQQIHHKDENKTNNKIDNLILLSKSKHIGYHNSCRSNKPKDLKHIYWHPINKNWVIQMVINHKQKHLGSYNSIEDAKIARDEILQLLIAYEG